MLILLDVGVCIVTEFSCSSSPWAMEALLSRHIGLRDF